MIIKKIFLLATSIKRDLSIFIIKSQPSANSTPMLSAYKDSIAEFGITLSYTVIVKIDVVKAKKFEIRAANRTWKYNQRLDLNAEKNQGPVRC